VDLETKIGQLFIYIAKRSERVGHHEREFLRHYRPAGLIYPAPRARQYAPHTRRGIAHYVADLQRVNDELGLPGPLIVCANHRGGDTSILPPDRGGLEFPAAIAQAALGDDAERAGEEIGAAVARDVLDTGFNLNLAPYADFLERGDIERFQFGNSMMGANPQTNAALSAGLIRGMQRAGLGTTYCVFPGGYGSLPQDPHHFAGVVPARQDELTDRYYLAPQAAFAAGVDAVMLSHFQFPALDPDSLPATFSPPIIQDVLRKELGFDGLIMTDAIRMRSVVEIAGSSSEAAVRAIEAGADIVLCASWEERIAVAEAVRVGRIPESRLDDAVERVMALKAKLAIEVPARRDEPEPIDTGRMAYWIGRSMTWARRRATWCPLEWTPTRRVVALASWPAFLDAAGEVCGEHVRTLRLPASNALSPQEDVESELLLSMTAEYDCVLFGTSTAADLRQAKRLQEAGRTVWVAHAGPVFDVDQAPELTTVLLTYSHTPVASRKAIEVFAGHLKARGQLPVPLATHAIASSDTLAGCPA
jgi:beta-N-acetylhexosaminidase